MVLLLKFSIRGWQTKLEEPVGGRVKKRDDRGFGRTRQTVIYRGVGMTLAPTLGMMVASGPSP